MPGLPYDEGFLPSDLFHMLREFLRVGFEVQMFFLRKGLRKVMRLLGSQCGDDYMSLEPMQ